MMRMVKISDVCEFQSGLWKGKKGPFTKANVIRNTNFRPNGNLSYENIAFLEVETKELYKRQLQHGDIILEKSGGGEKTPVGRVCLFEKQNDKTSFSLSNFTCFIRVKDPSILDYKFLHKFLYFMYEAGKTEPMQKNSTGIRNLQLKEYKDISIALPQISEQQRIVAKLNIAFTEIDKLSKIYSKKLKLINELSDCVLDNKLGNNSLKLNEACDLIKRGISPKYLKTQGVAVINQRCIRNHKIDYSKARRHNMNLKKVPEERFIRNGDVLINSTGQGTLGRVAQVKQDPFEKTTVDSHVTIVRPKKELFNLGFFGNSLIKIEKKLEAAAEGASGQTELSRSKLENEFFIPYVDSINEQKKISILLDSMFENTFNLKDLTVKLMENLKVLRLSFLQKEFNKKTK